MNKTMSRASRELRKLAAGCGIQTFYVDVGRRRQSASAETLMAVLAAWGFPVEGPADVAEALSELQRQGASRMLPWVLVAWEGKVPRIPLTQWPRNRHRAQLVMQLESGERIVRQARIEEARPEPNSPGPAAQPAPVAWLTWPEVLPWGYHHLGVDGESEQPALILSAPRQSYRANRKRRKWGVFAPVYGLHSASSWGGGNFSDLERLWEWVTELGGSYVATLPLLSAFLDEPYEFSPYAPASRLFWNEFYVDVERVPELAQCEQARQTMASDSVQTVVQDLRLQPHVDYRLQMQVQRQVLEQLAESCFRLGGERRVELERFVEEHPELSSYARFRAVTERERRPWGAWPRRQMEGELRSGDFDEAAYRYHLYVQWIAQQQVQHLTDKVGGSGTGLYLDLPLGVHQQGYDTWRNRDVFAMGAAGGAPPDTFFTKGQNWGFPPLHPQRLREDGYRYWIEVLRHQMRHAGMLRIDHIMQLYRLYWVPDGLDARQGAYVRYVDDELFAILCLESHRHQCLIVGENLGTVPKAVTESMRHHRLAEMYVVQYAAPREYGKSLPPAPKRSIAGLNTHDMPPFAAFWQGHDLEQLHELGLFDDAELNEQQNARRAICRNLRTYLEREGVLPLENTELTDILDALHGVLAMGRAENILLNLEDLWLEVEPQNMPGTSHERINWRRKLQPTLEQLFSSDAWRQRLQLITARRSGRTR
jgi:4-alpha-glucanotransferase